MEWNIESIIFYVLLIDAIGANVLAWSNGQRWWQRHMNLIARYMPLARGWTVYYLVLILLMGALLIRHDALVVPW